MNTITKTSTKTSNKIITCKHGNQYYCGLCGSIVEEIEKPLLHNSVYKEANNIINNTINRKKQNPNESHFESFINSVEKSSLKDKDKQVDALKKFKNGSISYSQMRGMCG